MAAFDTAVPTVDISPFTSPEAHSDAARRAVGKEWDAAMTNVGFAMITGHGVDPAIVDALRRGAHSFFGGPADAKQKYCYGPYGNPLGGFTGMGVEAVAQSRDDHGSDGGATQTTALPDLVESFVFKPEETTKPKPPSMDEAGHAYHAALLKVLDALHRVTAAALGLQEDFFAPFYAPPAKCSLRLAYYPPLAPSRTAWKSDVNAIDAIILTRWLMSTQVATDVVGRPLRRAHGLHGLYHTLPG